MANAATKARDADYTVQLIEKVEVSEGGYLTLYTTGGCLGVENREGVPLPEAGQFARFYGDGLGFSVRGVDILVPRELLSGKDAAELDRLLSVTAWVKVNVQDLFEEPIEFYYRTAAEEKAYRKSLRDAEQEKKARAFDETGKAKLDAQFVALPECFQQRIIRFRTHHPEGEREFRIGLEPYEMFVCAEAVKIATAFQGRENELAKATSDDFYSKHTGILSDGHSGNTAGAALMLAKARQASPEYVVWAHGAMTPLTGCEEYGCVTPSGTDWRPDVPDASAYTQWGTRSAPITPLPEDEEANARFQNVMLPDKEI